MLEQRGHDGLVALLGHHLVEALVRGVGHAAAALEAVEHLVLDRAEQRDPLRGDGEVAGARAARERGRVLGGQAVGAARAGRTRRSPPVAIAPSHSRT